TTIGELLRSLETAQAGTKAEERAEACLAMHRGNFDRLRAHGVRIAIGSDDYGSNSVNEAVTIARSGLMELDELLRAWCQTTPETIFPARKLGRLEEGYEASFLVLGGDPLEDFEHVRDIRLRVKQGRVLALE